MSTLTLSELSREMVARRKVVKQSIERPTRENKPKSKSKEQVSAKEKAYRNAHADNSRNYRGSL